MRWSFAKRRIVRIRTMREPSHRVFGFRHAGGVAHVRDGLAGSQPHEQLAHRVGLPFTAPAQGRDTAPVHLRCYVS